jgi:uncharacterized protein (TIGR00251 family)
MKIQLKVKPNSQQQKVIELENGNLKVYLKSSPTKGKANRELIKLLFQRYHVNQAQITIKGGLFNPNKTIEIE